MNNKLTKILFLSISLVLILFSCSNPINSQENSESTELDNTGLQDDTLKTSYSGNKPFPQFVDYGVHISKPTDPGNGYKYRVNDILVYYWYWKRRYLKLMPGTPPRYYVKQYYYYEKEKGAPGAPSSGTGWGDWLMYDEGNQKYLKAYGTSEGLGYGMLLTAIMGDEYPFTRLLCTYDYFKSTEGSGLMSWIIPYYKNPRSSSATDGDMDVAYALLLADKQWPNKGYKNKALDIIYKILNWNVVKVTHPSNNRVSWRLSLGDWVKILEPTDSVYYTQRLGGSRPSDWMIGHLTAFMRVLPKGSGARGLCNALRIEILDMIDHIQNKYSPNTGLVPDFVEGLGWLKPNLGNYFFDLHPVTSKGITNNQGDRVYLEYPTDNIYSYNASRFPWRMACAYATATLNGGGSKFKRKISARMFKISDWVRHNYPKPGLIQAGYYLNGNEYANWEEDNFIASFISSNITRQGPAGGWKIKRNRNYLQTGWNSIYRIPKGADSEKNYFSDTITLLNLILINGNWWAP